MGAFAALAAGAVETGGAYRETRRTGLRLVLHDAAERKGDADDKVQMCSLRG
jgi:hypothetical protein